MSGLALEEAAPGAESEEAGGEPDPHVEDEEAEKPVKRKKIAWSDDLSHDSEEERGKNRLRNCS